MALTITSNNKNKQQQKQKRNKNNHPHPHHRGGGTGIVTVFVVIIFLVLFPLIIEKKKLNLFDNFIPSDNNFKLESELYPEFYETTSSSVDELQQQQQIKKGTTATKINGTTNTTVIRSIILPSIKPGGERGIGGASSADDTSTAIIIKSNSNAELIIWVNTRNFDNNFIVAEKYVGGRPKQFKRFTEVKEYEIRRCITSSKFLNMTTIGLPICPTKLLKSTSKDEYILKICYDNNNNNNQNQNNVSASTTTSTPAGGRRIPKIEPMKMIVGIEDAKSLETPLTKFLGYRNIEVSHNNCPLKCDQENYKFDEIDRLCKSTVPQSQRGRIYAGSCHYETTCFTPNAVQTNSTWPWPSVEYKSKFYNPSNEIWKRDQKRKNMWLHQRLRTQPYEMRFLCNNHQNNTTTPSTTSNQNQNQNQIPLPELAYGSFQHMLFYIPQGKLIFCGIPKGGVTEWSKFARYTMGAQDYLSVPWYKLDREEFFISRLTRHKAAELLFNKSKNWTLAIFFRDPAERLLSAYQNKIVNEGYTQKFFQIYNGTDGFWKKSGNNGEQRYVLSFREFVNLVTYDNSNNLTDHKGLSGKVDPHWQPQSMMCGMDYLLPYVDFIGNFNHIAVHTKQLLQRVGLWDNYGSKFDPADDGILKNVKIGSPRFAIPPPWMFRNNSTNYTATGFNQLGPTSTTAHTTKSSTKMDEYYNTPDLLEKVRTAYKYDYEIWDDINNNNDDNNFPNRSVDDIITGNDLNIVKTYCK